jgi:HEAT repeat protein
MLAFAQWLRSSALSVVAIVLLQMATRPAAICQVAQTQPRVSETSRVGEALTKLASGTFNQDDVEAVHEAGLVVALAPLEKQFEQNSSPEVKQEIASALVKLGDKDSKYWTYLVEEVSPALSDDAPFFLGIDGGGKITDTPSPEFQTWANSKQLPIEKAVEREMFDYPGAVMELGLTGDDRAIPFLRRALLSQDLFVELAAARGLAELQDHDSIPLIIEACKRAPQSAAAQIALPLVYFDDSIAQEAFDHYVPKDIAAETRKARAAGDKPFGENPLRSAQ